jgi:hypothetical protein
MMGAMTEDHSPDEPQGTETFEQGDEALAESSRIDPDFLEALELDPSLEPSLQLDERELEEAGAEFDDPEDIVLLDGGIDDPDGREGPTPRRLAREADHEGWDLDTPVAGTPDGAEDGAEA